MRFNHCDVTIVQGDRVLNWLRYNCATQPQNSHEKLTLYISRSSPSVFEAKLQTDFSKKSLLTAASAP